MQPIKKYNLNKLIQTKLSLKSSALVSRQSGLVVRNCIEEMISAEKEGVLIALDFSEVSIIDFSCADEIVAKLISRLLGGEYGDKFIMLTGLEETQIENIEVALERRNLPVIAETRDSNKVLLGSLNNYLRETLQIIKDNKRMTARELSEKMKLEANTSGTRLLNLFKKRLVFRHYQLSEGSRSWIYEYIQT